MSSSNMKCVCSVYQLQFVRKKPKKDNYILLNNKTTNMFYAFGNIHDSKHHGLP